MLLKLEVFPLLTTFMILTSVGVLTNPRGMSVNLEESSDVNALHQSHGEMEAYTPHKSDYTIAIDGSIQLGYYYATFFLGYPPQKQTFIVDTGSSITAVPCSDCLDCGSNHFNEKYDPRRSMYSRRVGWEEKIGDFIRNSCFTDKCNFSIEYTEGSYYSIKDIFSNHGVPSEHEELLQHYHFTVDSEAFSGVRWPRVNFGCIHREEGLVKRQKADGILGLGANTDTSSVMPNFVDTITQAYKEIFTRSFSLCLSSSEGGYLTIGGRDDKHLDIREPSVIIGYKNDSGQYQIQIHTLTLNGEAGVIANAKDFSHSEIVIDSGTTMLYLTPTIRKNLMARIRAFCSKNSAHCGGSSPIIVEETMCYKRDLFSWPSLNNFQLSFPNVTFTLDDNQSYTLSGKEYLFLFSPEGSQEYYCLGIFAHENRIILGSIFMRNHDFHFDKENRKIAMTPANCSALMPLIDRSNSEDPVSWEEPKMLNVDTEFIKYWGVPSEIAHVVILAFQVLMVVAIACFFSRK